MASKGGNPFLMDYADPADQGDTTQQASNPFLQDFEAPSDNAPASGGGGENPFLNFAADQSTYQPPTDSTNPFAFFGVEPTQDAQFSAPEPTATSAAEDFGANQPNFFGIEEPSPVTQNFFDTGEPPKSDILVEPVQPDTFGQPVESEKSPAAPPVAKNARPTPARPPPPPRPHPPLPPKNTKDLILSVTGAMDATSNHLLDRLQATRTPSPTLMHSPSPTPEHSFADLLDVDGNVPDLLSDESRQTVTSKNQDIMDLFDAPNTESAGDNSMFSGGQVDLDTTNQLVSGAETAFASGVVGTATKITEHPFSVGVDDPPSSPDQEVDSFVSEGLISRVEEKRASTDSGATPLSGG